MSQFGSGGMPSQAPQAGQVTFFDPTKFQKGSTDFPPISSAATQQLTPFSAAPAVSHAAISGENAWSSWSSWNGDSNVCHDSFSSQSAYVNSSTSQSNYVNSHIGQDVNAHYDTTDQHQGNFPTSAANDVDYNQQWYDQSNWNQDPQQQGYQWDPNSQQWGMGQYDYSQVQDPNQYAGYDPAQYWGGGAQGNNVNGHGNVNAYNTDYQQEGDGNQIVQSTNNYSVNDPRSHLAQNNDTINTEEEQESGTSATESSARQETSDELDVSQSTTESESQSHSLGQQEEGSFDGYFQNDDFVQESETKVIQDNEQMAPLQVKNSGSGDVIEQHKIDDNSEAGLVSQMQEVSLQDNMSQDAHGNVQACFQPSTYQSEVISNTGSQFPVPQAQPEVPTFSAATFAGRKNQDTHQPVAAQGEQSEPKHSGETPTFSDWEMVPPQQENQATHSRNASIDNNVHFFISSNNSSARVSPATSAKTGAEDQENLSTDHGNKPKEVTAEVKTKENSEPNKVNIGPPPSNLRPPSQGSNRGDNPFRKSPNTSMLSSTQLDNTKGNISESPVTLNKSISPIPPTEEIRSERQRQANRETDSPDIHTSKHIAPGGETPLSANTKKQKVPQSPIMPRKESPFQPPAKIPDGKGKPLRASHDIPGVNNYTQKKNSDEINPDPKERKDKRTPDRDDKRYEGRRTPDWDARDRKREDRRTPEVDSRNRRREGRKTPEWDGDRRREGRRTPEWDSDRKKEGRRTPDWDRQDKRDRDRLTGRPPVAPSEGSRSHRSRQSAFHQVNRSRNNVSPATSLWDTPDDLPNVSNILLMPAAGNTSSISDAKSDSKDSSAPSLLTPVVSLITSMSEHIKTDNPNDKSKKQDVSKGNDDTGDRSDRTKDSRYDRDKDSTMDSSVRSGYSRDKDRDTRERIRSNRSYESLRDRGGKESRNGSRERSNMYGSRDSLDQDDPRDRGRRGDSRDRERGGYRDRDNYYDRYRDRDRDRPPSRTSTVDGYGRRDYRDRDRDRDYTRRERPDRPRSRQADRPPSRHADGERPKSYDQYYKDNDQYYKDKYRNTEYDYDDYYRRRHYYDRQYYDYYYGNYSQGGYYDEYGYYHQDSGPARYQYDYYQRRSRTGTPGSLSDGGEEISKIAETSKKSDSKSDKKRFDYPPDLHDYSRGGYDEYASYYGYENSGYRWDPDIHNWVATTTDVVPQRQTPEKFLIPHVQACFGPNGQLVRVVPNRPADGEPATVEIIDVQELLNDTEESEELKEFPGPLVKGDTHKNDILLFCQRKAKACSENMALEDRDSAELIWKFLELLIKQNGTVVGTDIADLLLQGHEPTTLDYRRTGMRIAASTDYLEGEDDTDDSRVSRGTTPVEKTRGTTPVEKTRGTTPVDRSMISKAKSVEEVTDRFRHLLLYGRKKDALEWAMKNNLWGHALFLASKMDTRAHANVMTRFANVAMRMNDPLQTLYQLMSGRQPAAVTSVTEERWGDWRPHLAMVLSNHTHKPELDRKCITTLGDTLASKGLLHASHFCYLMSQTSFGSYTRKSSKIVLIGSSHGQPLDQFANNEAIQCTEIYEYALALGNMYIGLANFQYFKYLYCTRLVDCGYAQEALQYCEVISRNINSNPAFYSHILVKLIYDLSCQLKFADPQYSEEGEDVPDPDWLRGLHTTLVQFEEGAIQPVSGSATPAFYGGGTTASSDSGEVGMYMQPGDTNYLQQQHPGAQQYDTTQLGGEQVENQYADHMTSAENQYGQQGVGTYEHTGEGYVQQPAEGQYHQPQWPDQTTELTNQGQEYNQHPDGTANQFAGMGDQQVPHYQPNQHMGTNQWSAQPHQHHHSGGFQPNVNLGESQTSGMSGESAKRSSLASTSSFSQDGGGDEEGEGEDQTDGGYHQQPSIFDLQPAQTKIIAPRLRQRTISESSTGSQTGHKKPSSATQSEKSSGLDAKSKQQQQQKQGGGIWNKLGGLFSRKNEMKLPDDKEPSIVWDPVKKKWVDKDSNETDSSPAPPPPKDNELSGPSHMPSVPENPSPAAPVANPGGPPPPMGANKFSRRKDSLGARSQYVDVMNPKPAATSSVPPSLFNTLPNSKSAPAIFNPGGPADISDPAPQTKAQETIPEEKTNNTGLSLPPIDNSEAPAAPTGLPAMFNPAQFQANQGFKQPAAPAPGHRLSSRRVYPK